MRMIFAAAILAATAVSASAQYGNRNSGYTYGTGSNPSSNYVNPYTRSDGSSVGGHYRTNPNSSLTDNYGAPGNTNPYTGRTSGPRRY